MHEFEALLFSDVRVIDATLQDLHGAPNQLRHLQQIVDDYGHPEAINDDPKTAPSKRLAGLYPGYDKVAFGDLIAEQIGMARMREQCPHFDAWVGRLEELTPLR